MAYSETIFAPSRATLDIAVLILPRASILEVASVLDPMRNANRQTRREAFRWRVVTPDGQAAPLTCGIELPASGSLGDVAGADLLVIVSGFDQAEVATRALIATLRRMAGRFPTLTLVHNPKRLQSAGVNMAVRAFARPYHRVLVRCDAHSGYPPGYLEALGDRAGAIAGHEAARDMRLALLELLKADKGITWGLFVSYYKLAELGVEPGPNMARALAVLEEMEGKGWLTPEQAEYLAITRARITEIGQENQADDEAAKSP